MVAIRAPLVRATMATRGFDQDRAAWQKVLNRRGFRPGLQAWRAAVDASRAVMFSARRPFFDRPKTWRSPSLSHRSRTSGVQKMAVGAQQDPGRGPMPADLPDQPADTGGALGPPGTPGRAQQRSGEPAFAIEDDDRLETELVVTGIERTQLLTAMHGIESIVDIQHDPGGNRRAAATDPPCTRSRATGSARRRTHVGTVKSRQDRLAIEG